MARPRGIERRIRDGFRGPKPETIRKIFAKKIKQNNPLRASMPFLKPNANWAKIFEEATIRQTLKVGRAATRIAVSKALNAIGFDPKNKRHYIVRKRIHKLMQEFEDINTHLSLRMINDKQENQHFKQELERIVREVDREICAAHGSKLGEKISAVFPQIYIAQLEKVSKAQK